MATATGLPGRPGTEQIRAEVDAVLASEFFSRAPSLAQFLSYVCRKALEGEGDQIKEYNIAIEAFGRQPDFDQKADAIVRVEAHRLRKRLKQYYEGEGVSHTVKIVIPPGQYVPEFVTRESAPTRAEASGKAEDSSGALELNEQEASAAEPAGGERAALPAPAPEAVPSHPLSLERVGPVLLAPPIELAPPAKRPFSRRAIYLIAGVAVLAGAIAVVVNRRSAGPAPGQAPAGAQTAAPDLQAPGVPLAEEGLRIAAGLGTGKYADSDGNLWLGDRYFLGGQVLASPAERILRTRDPALFRNRREGDFRYDIPLEPGTYELHLLFAEPVFGTGNLAGGGETSRLFHVFANGVPILEQLDVISDAAGSNTADVKVFKDISPAPDGFLHLRFSRFKENAFVNGIAILPSSPGRLQPIRMVASDVSVRDSGGRLWSADQYWQGGQIISRNSRVTGTNNPELYRSERFGNFAYALPVADGRYTLTLYFSETWFVPSQPGGGGVGSRVFDVYSNGTALLKDFDVFKAAAGGNRAVEKTFHGLRPSAQGKLMVSFVPVRNYAIVNAIEVTEETP